MTPKSTFAGIALLAAGLVTGVYLQHRWPLGRLAHELRQSPPSAAGDVPTISNLPSARRLVLLVAGQSNAANCGESRRAIAAASLSSWLIEKPALRFKSRLGSSRSVASSSLT